MDKNGKEFASGGNDEKNVKFKEVNGKDYATDEDDDGNFKYIVSFLFYIICPYLVR
jgi:hypothetical protein